MGFFTRVKKESTVTKSFNYQVEKVSLSFKLRTDIKTELKNFLECLKVAQKEVEEELANHN